MNNKYALIGYPISHSLSPLFFKTAYRGRYEYDLIEKPDFKDCLDTFLNGSYRACNVTAPFKKDALLSADEISEEAELCQAANILVKKDGKLIAYNSDFLAVRSILQGICHDNSTVLVIGGGGAGRAAAQAALSLGLSCRVLHHDELSAEPPLADVVIFTLPRPAPGYEDISCNYLLEANYKDPCCKHLTENGQVKHYISGKNWLIEQARLGYELMTGEVPQLEIE